VRVRRSSPVNFLYSSSSKCEHAGLCYRPCHAIAPVFEQLANRYKDVNFLKVDVDASPAIAKRYRVSAMPTFVFLKGQTKVDQVCATVVLPLLFDAQRLRE
jgi:hypothetical protein